MGEQKPFQVEVAVAASADRVWAALTDPVEVRRWHGWDSEGLEAEIQFIYVDHATRIPPDRIELEDGAEGQVVELVPQGPSTVVRISRPGTGPGGADRYDEIEEGWRSFFQQMRHYLERHPDEERRTVYLLGQGVASRLATALVQKVPGRPWFESMFQRGIAIEDHGGGLVVLSTREPLDSDRPGAVHVTLTTHGLDDDAFSSAKEDWRTWWTSLVEKPEIVVR